MIVDYCVAIPRSRRKGIASICAEEPGRDDTLGEMSGTLKENVNCTLEGLRAIDGLDGDTSMEDKPSWWQM
jgi:hypothetical protein